MGKGGSGVVKWGRPRASGLARLLPERAEARVRAAFLAAAERWDWLRRPEAERAWRESAEREAAERPSRFKAPVTARERLAEGLRRRLEGVRSAVAVEA